MYKLHYKLLIFISRSRLRYEKYAHTIHYQIQQEIVQWKQFNGVCIDSLSKTSLSQFNPPAACPLTPSRNNRRVPDLCPSEARVKVKQLPSVVPPSQASKSYSSNLHNWHPQCTYRLTCICPENCIMVYKLLRLQIFHFVIIFFISLNSELFITTTA